MKHKPVVLAIIVSMLLLFGWAVKHYYVQEVPPTEAPNSEPALILPDSPKETTNSEQVPAPSEPSAKKNIVDERPSGSQSISVDKTAITDDKSADLSEQTISIKREDDKGYEVMPGVNIKDKAIHVQLDDENTRSIQIEKNPPNSNNQYQVLVKKKF